MVRVRRKEISVSTFKKTFDLAFYRDVNLESSGRRWTREFLGPEGVPLTVHLRRTGVWWKPTNYYRDGPSHEVFRFRKRSKPLDTKPDTVCFDER